MGFVDYRQCEVLAKNSFSELNGIERLVHNHSLYTHLFQREFALSLEVQAEENSVISQHMLVADVSERGIEHFLTIRVQTVVGEVAPSYKTTLKSSSAF